MKFNLDPKAKSMSDLLMIADERCTFLTDGLGEVILRAITKTAESRLESAKPAIIESITESVKTGKPFSSIEISSIANVMGNCMMELAEFCEANDVAYDEAALLFFIFGDSRAFIDATYKRVMKRKVNEYLKEYSKEHPETPDFTVMMGDGKDSGLGTVLDLLTEVFGKLRKDSGSDKIKEDIKEEVKEDIRENV